jgi:hypothetical protein
MRAHLPKFATAAAGFALAAAPAFAQQAPSLPRLSGAAPPQGYYSAQADNDDSYHGDWSGSYIDLDGNVVEGNFGGSFVGDTLFVADHGPVLSEDGSGRWSEAETVNEGPDGPPPPGPGARGRMPHMHPMPMRPGMRPPLPPQPGQPMPQMGYTHQQREDWLNQCRHRLSDKGRDADHVRDRCEAYLERYETGYGGGAYGGGHYGGSFGAGYGYGYRYPAGAGCHSACSYPAMAMPMAMPMMWVPVMIPAQNRHCHPKVKVHTYVTEEVIPGKTRKIVTYEKVPAKVVETKYIKTKTVPAKPKPIKQGK